ncbi:MAG: hypothetical protein KBD04_03030 [Proteobacteria bacterium]|nr:hypothetical protein [Pseudomonadota bacterium]
MLRCFIIAVLCCFVFGSGGETAGLDSSSNEPTLLLEKASVKVTFKDDDLYTPIRSSFSNANPQPILKETSRWKKCDEPLNPQPSIKHIFHVDEKKKERLAYSKQIFDWCEEQNVEVSQNLKIEVMQHVECLSDEDFFFLDHLSIFHIPSLFCLLTEPRHLAFIRHISAEKPFLVQAPANILFICQNFDRNSFGVCDHLISMTEQDFENFKYNVQRTKQKVLTTAHNFTAKAQLTRDDAIRITRLVLTNPNPSDYRIYDLAVPVVKRVSWIRSWLMMGLQDHLHGQVFNS